MNSASTIAIVCFIVAQSFSQASAIDDRTFYVKIDEATTIQGQLLQTEGLKFSTSFGEVTLPIEKIEAIKMSGGGDNSAVVAFVNGDMVTGKLDIDELHLKTSWGKAYVNAISIDMISSSQFGSFYNDSNGGWRFSRGSSQQFEAMGNRNGRDNRNGSGTR